MEASNSTIRVVTVRVNDSESGLGGSKRLFLPLPLPFLLQYSPSLIDISLSRCTPT